jgi:hypothetical protein
MPIRLRGLEEALRQIGRFPDKMLKGARILQQAVARDMFIGIVGRTPVDKGFAAASWRMNTGSRLGSTADPGEYKLRSSRGQISRQAARSKAIGYARQQLNNLKLRPGGSSIPTIYITNNVAYIGMLEGTEGGPISNQAPSGMVRVTKNSVLEKFRSIKVITV